MAGEILYFMHRHVRLLTAVVMASLLALVALGVAGVLLGSPSASVAAADVLNAQVAPAA